MITWQKVRVIQLSSVMKSRGSLCSHFFADIWFLLRNGVTSACSPNLMKPRLMSMSLSNKSRSRCRHPSLEQWADNFHVVRWKKDISPILKNSHDIFPGNSRGGKVRDRSTYWEEIRSNPVSLWCAGTLECLQTACLLIYWDCVGVPDQLVHRIFMNYLLKVKNV